MANTTTQVAIRRYAERIRRISNQRSAMDILRRTSTSEMEESRQDVIKFFAGNLLRRFAEQTKGMSNPPTLTRWLSGKDLEDTYKVAAGSRGNTLARRQGFASRVVKEALREQNSPEGEVSDNWLKGGVRKILNSGTGGFDHRIIIVRRPMENARPDQETYHFMLV